MGNGRKIDFWNEHCIGDESLQSLFPDLFMLTTQNKVTISQLWSRQGWNLIFRKAFNDWEIERVVNLFQILNAFPGTFTESDKPIWRWQSKGVFTVKSWYCRYNIGQTQVRNWPWKLTWKKKIPLKTHVLLG